ncbi:MAG: hypothetical protein H0T86_15450 [Gemmatimonadales bacterium]|nr:hypothetical protein [Gemmatimonadales bacterium]
MPELGPSLGRMVDPPAAPVGALEVSLDDIRLGLVTAVFELAGAARSRAAAGDLENAVASLGRPGWLVAWEQAVGGAASRIASAANAALRRAAEESRYPVRRLRTLAVTGADTSGIAARLGSGGGSFMDALDLLEQATPIPGRARDRGADAWRAALTAAARRLESAWLALEAAAAAEQERWAEEVGLVGAWRRPTWPLWAVTGVVGGAASYLGLILGGYLPVPAPLAGFASFWWAWP